MTIAGLEFIEKELHGLGINYAFGRWYPNKEPEEEPDAEQEADHVEEQDKDPEIVYPYWVGSFTEVPSDDGPVETTFILEGFTRGSYLELLENKETIENHFMHGITAILDYRSGVAVVYSDANCDIPTGDANLKKIQVNLTVKEWKVN